MGAHSAGHRTAAGLRNPPAVPYAPGLDGVRGLAVVGVLAYHLDLVWAGGGFLGVEVFFILSGFLITQLLVAELGRTGRVDVTAFAVARAKRLVPALVACLAATTLAFRLLLPDDAPGLRADAVASLLYAQNWHLILAGEPYGSAFERPSPLQHLWSLAVEGQLYLLWSVLFVAVLATWRRGWAALAAVAVAGISALLLAARHDPDASGFAYYATDGRASGFLVGAALAVLWQPASWSGPLRPAVRRAVDVAGLLALVVLLAGFAWVSEFDDELYGSAGFLRTGLVTAVLILAATRPGSTVSGLLSGRVLRWLGQRSYGIYLYHWPLFVLTRTEHDNALLDAARLAATFVIAELSYRLLETPIRRARVLVGLGPRGAVAVAGCVVAVTIASCMAATVPTEPPAPASTIAVSAAPLSAPPVTPEPTPTPAPPTTTTPPPSTATGPALVVGDSIAMGAAGALRAALGTGTAVDAVVGRQFAAGVSIVRGWTAGHPGPIVVVLGANGTVQARDVQALIDAAGRRRLVLVGVAVPRRWKNGNNEVLRAAARDHGPDVVFLDWAAIVAAHPGTLGDDRVHPTPAGSDLLGSAIAGALGR